MPPSAAPETHPASVNASPRAESPNDDNKSTPSSDGAGSYHTAYTSTAAYDLDNDIDGLDELIKAWKLSDLPAGSSSNACMIG